MWSLQIGTFPSLKLLILSEFDITTLEPLSNMDALNL